MKRALVIVVVLILGVTSWMLFDNRRRIVLEGTTDDGVAWDLGWLPDRATDDGVCVDIRTRGGEVGVSGRYCAVRDAPAASESFPPVLDHILMGWIPEAEVQSSEEGTAFVSSPVPRLAGQRLFVQFLTTDEFPLEDATINGRPIVTG
jgi:hypothetical protein